MTLLAAGLAAVLALGPAQPAASDTNVTTHNDSSGTKTRSGNARAENTGQGTAGHVAEDSDAATQDVSSENATNVQEGDNEVEAEQSANSRSGDVVGGQVIGAVSSGELEINATNRSEDVDLTSGDAVSANSFQAFAGLLAAGGNGTATAADVLSGNAANVQEGDNSASVSQTTDAVSGDAVGGQVLGAVTTGSAAITVANTSTDVDVTTGDAEMFADVETVVGLVASGAIVI